MPSESFPLPDNPELDANDHLVVFGRVGDDGDPVAVEPATGHVWMIWTDGLYVAAASVDAFCLSAQVMRMALDHASDLEPFAAIPFVRGVTHGLQVVDPVVPTGHENIWDALAR